MNIDKVAELIDEARSIAILLEHDLYMQKQDETTVNAMKVLHHLLNDAAEELAKKEDMCSES